MTLECPIIYFVSLIIGILMPYYFYNNSPILHLNAIFYCKQYQLLLGGIIVDKMKTSLWVIFYYLDTRFPTPNNQPFLTF